MKFLKILFGSILSFVAISSTFAAVSPNFVIDMDSMNNGGQVSQSTHFKLNDTITGLVNGSQISSNSFALDSGLVNLELYCGNDILEFGEQCDDGNRANGDGCSSTCVTQPVTPPTPTPTTTPTSGGGYRNLCGNGAYDPYYGEQCDDGNSIDGDGCNHSCLLEKTKKPVVPTDPVVPIKLPVVTEGETPVEKPEAPSQEIPIYGPVQGPAEVQIIPEKGRTEVIVPETTETLRPAASECFSTTTQIYDLMTQNQWLLYLLIIFLILFLVSFVINIRQRWIIKKLNKMLKRR